MIEKIEQLMKYEAAGDPMTGTKWTRITPKKIAKLIGDSLRIEISRNTVTRILKEMKFSLKGNRKTIAIQSASDRNEQFAVIRDFRESFEAQGAPIISVDTKKKELIGRFKNGGKVWTREALRVYDHDFRSAAQGRAVPYGIYDIQKNQGFVFVGTSYETSDFAVNSIARWWRYQGQNQYSSWNDLLILADGGGSNGYRRRRWKVAIQEKLCDRYGLAVTVVHYPAGASKWNPIEHRLFSEISKNWAGRPLDSLKTILNYIETTTTSTGLQVKSYLDTRKYEKGVRVSDDAMQDLLVETYECAPKWNYTIQPR